MQLETWVKLSETLTYLPKKALPLKLNVPVGK